MQTWQILNNRNKNLYQAFDKCLQCNIFHLSPFLCIYVASEHSAPGTMDKLVTDAWKEIQSYIIDSPLTPSSKTVGLG